MVSMGTIHCIAKCRECNWTEENFKIAMKKAREHSKNTGHIVDAEQGKWYVYGKTK